MSKILKFADWNFRNVFEDESLFSYETGEDFLNVVLNGKRYTVVKFFCKSLDVKGNHTYKIEYYKEVSGLDLKFIFGWYDKEDKLKIRGYAENGEIIVSPDDVTALEIVVLVRSHTKGDLKLSDIKVTEIGEYVPKMVKLATIALDYDGKPLPISLEYNLNTTLERIDALCINEKPDLVVLTETFYTRKSLLPIRQAALPEDSEPLNLVREKAKKYNTYIALSYAEKENGNYCNSGILIGRNGEIVGKCHKVHLTMAEYECGMVPGDEIKVFDTDIGRIAIAICWDLFFANYASEILHKKVDIVCHPTAGYTDTRVMQRAKDCGAYLVVSTVTKHENSVILDPEGRRLADASEHNGYGCVEVDINKPVYTYWQSYPADTDGKNIYYHESRWDLYNGDC